VYSYQVDQVDVDQLCGILLQVRQWNADFLSGYQNPEFDMKTKRIGNTHYVFYGQMKITSKPTAVVVFCV